MHTHTPFPLGMAYMHVMYCIGSETSWAKNSLANSLLPQLLLVQTREKLSLLEASHVYINIGLLQSETYGNVSIA